MKIYRETVRLDDVLRRRRTTLDAWASEMGLTSYDDLAAECSRMGVDPVAREEWDALRPQPQQPVQEVTAQPVEQPAEPVVRRKKKFQHTVPELPVDEEKENDVMPER